MTTTHTRDVVGYAAAFAPLLAVLVAVGVALVQYYLQREKLKLDLFEKRLKVHDAVMRFLEQIYRTGELSKHYSELVDRTNRAHFFFRKEVTEYLRRLITATDALNKDLSRSRGSSPLDKDKQERIVSLLNQRYYPLLRGAKEAFDPYLQIVHDEPWPARFSARINRWINQEVPAAMASRYDAY